MKVACDSAQVANRCSFSGSKGEVRIDGVILDLDGLVLDTEIGYWFAWKHAAKSMGYKVSSSLLESLSGRDSKEVRRRMMVFFGEDFEWREFTRRSNEFWYRYVWKRGIPVKRGVLSCLALFEKKGVPYCLATNSHRANALECLELAGLGGRFDLIVARDDVRLGKPSPEVFLLASARLAVGADRCLVLEDSGSGVAGARAAGAFTVLVPSMSRNDPSTRRLAHRECRDLQQVSERLAVLWS